MLGEALGIEFNNPHPLYCCTFSPFSCILISWHVVVEECYLPGITKLVAMARVAHDFCWSSVQPAPPPIIIDDEPEWEVDEIVDSCFYGRTLEYLARWVGFDELTWEPADLFANAPSVVK